MILEFVIDLKKKYENKFGVAPLKNIGEKSCVIQWAEKLNYGIDILKNLTIRQNGDFVIFKYMKFEVLFAKDDDISYSQFWDIHNGIYRECRGVTIDVRNECYVTRPFDKFFGIDEREETSEKNIRKMIKCANVVEFSDKIDGSIIISRWYKDNVFVSSSGMIVDSLIVNSARKILLTENYLNFLKNYSNWTCIFELVSPMDVHIVSYGPDMHGLHLIGMRNVSTGELKPYSELDDIVNEYNIMGTEYIGLGFDDILKTRGDYKASEKEGYVMYIDGVLIKIKFDDYILMHKMWMTKCSMNGLIEAVYKDRIDDLMMSVPDNFKKVLDDGLKTIALYENLMQKAVDKYSSFAPTDRVEFFKWVKTINPHIGRYITNNYLGKPISFLVLRDDGKQAQYIKYAKIEELIEFLQDDLLK